MHPKTMEMVTSSLSSVLGAAVLEHKIGSAPMPEDLAEVMVEAIAPSFALDAQEKAQMIHMVYIEALFYKT